MASQAIGEEKKREEGERERKSKDKQTDKPVGRLACLSVCVFVNGTLCDQNITQADDKSDSKLTEWITSIY